MTRMDQKLANIRAGRYKPTDFIIADAKDGDMGGGIQAGGPVYGADGKPTRYRTRAEFLDQIQALVEQDVLDIMLLSASNLEQLVERGVFKNSAVKPVIRANDTSDIWSLRGSSNKLSPSIPFRTASLPRVMTNTPAPTFGMAPYLTDLGLYSMTFNNDLEADIYTLENFAEFRAEAAETGFKYFLEVFNPNVDTGIAPEAVPDYVNDCIVRALAGVTKADRPQFLKIVYNGPKALEDLATYDPSLIVGVLGGGGGTHRDTFEIVSQAERYGARVALFGRKINNTESQLHFVTMMRAVADGTIKPAEAVRAYHGELQKLNLKPIRSIEDDTLVTEAPLKQAAG